MTGMTGRLRAGLALTAVLGVVLIGLGIYFLSGEATTWRQLFGLREVFLGGLLLALLATRQWRAVLTMIVALTALPVADTLVLAPTLGWRDAALANLPYELPLLVAVALLWPLWRTRLAG